MDALIYWPPIMPESGYNPPSERPFSHLNEVSSYNDYFPPIMIEPVITPPTIE